MCVLCVEMESVNFSFGSSGLNVLRKHVEYSPLLKTMLESGVGLAKGEHGDIILGAEWDEKDLEEYFGFLVSGRFDYFNEKMAVLLDFMGHRNDLDLPLDDWKVLLEDKWTRDNMYRLELWKDPYHGLVRISPIMRRINIMNEVSSINGTWRVSEERHGRVYLPPQGTVVAGSAALWMAGGIEKYSDIDHFFICPKE